MVELLRAIDSPLDLVLPASSPRPGRAAASFRDCNSCALPWRTAILAELLLRAAVRRVTARKLQPLGRGSKRQRGGHVAVVDDFEAAFDEDSEEEELDRPACAGRRPRGAAGSGAVHGCATPAMGQVSGRDPPPCQGSPGLTAGLLSRSPSETVEARRRSGGGDGRPLLSLLRWMAGGGGAGRPPLPRSAPPPVSHGSISLAEVSLQGCVSSTPPPHREQREEAEDGALETETRSRGGGGRRGDVSCRRAAAWEEACG